MLATHVVRRRGVPAQLVAKLDHLGISSWANVIAAIKIARAHDLRPQQAVLTVATDGAKAGAGRMAHETSSSANPTPEIAEPFNLLRRPRI